MIQSFKSEKVPLDFLEALRLCMNYGFISKEDIRSWALMTIRDNQDYDLNLLELIEGKEADAREIDYKIRKLTNGRHEIENSKRILPGIVCRQVQKNEMSEKEAAALLNEFYFQIEFSECEKDRFYGLDHEVYLAEVGIHGNLDDIHKKIRETLRPYEKLRLDNYYEWNKINEEIERNIKPATNRVDGSAPN